MWMQDHKVAVRRCVERGQAELYALVLSARGIGSVIVQEGGDFLLLIAPEDLDEAEGELAAHDAENQSPFEEEPVKVSPPSVELVLIYWAVLLFFFAAARRDAFSIAWLEIGSAQIGPIRAGEWWRTITALFLHVSGTHLLSNLVFGSMFLLLLSQVLGPGMTALAVVVAGATGNSLNTLIRPELYTSIGASTAIFAAIGLLAALRQNWRVGGRPFSPRDWVPLAGGLMLLAILGFSGEQTDILAHVFGFAAGAAGGLLFVWLDQHWPENHWMQVTSGWATIGLVVLAWCWGIVLRP
jgi:membrane associated rhomboid family serine protease